MNNNRSNRRRGRGSNRPQGGNQLNRIDSRARGNAPQLLEKYKKLAHDASLNGDRVQTEYYLQFADHYFRVISDTKARQDEQRARRDEQREQADSGDGNDEGDTSRSRERPRRAERDASSRDDDGDIREDGDRDDSPNEYEPSENPFTRGNRGRSNQRRPRNTARDDSREASDEEDGSAKGLDPSILPPAIGSGNEESEKAPAPKRRRTAKPKPSVEGGDETLQQVN